MSSRNSSLLNHLASMQLEGIWRACSKGLSMAASAAFLATALATPVVQSQSTEPVTLERIMSHPQWLGRTPQNPYWGLDSSTAFYVRSEPLVDNVDPRLNELYRHPLQGGPEEIAVSRLSDVPADNYVWNQDRTLAAWERDGDLFVQAAGSETSPRQLTKTSDRESRPFFLTDGRVGYQRGRNKIYARDLGTGLEEQLFELVADFSPKEKDEKAREKRDYVAREEERLIEWVDAERVRKEQRRLRGEARLRDPASAPEAWYLGDRISILGITPSPDGELALVRIADKGKPRQGTEMPTYVSLSGNIEVRDVRSKVGTQPVQNHRLLILDRLTREQFELEFDQLPGRDKDPLEDLRKAAEARKKAMKSASKDATAEADDQSNASNDQDSAEDESSSADAKNGQDEKRDGAKKGDKKQTRPISIGRMIWSDQGEVAIVSARSRDNKDRWLVRLTWPELSDQRSPSEVPSEEESEHAEMLEPEQEIVHHLHNEAWVNRAYTNFGLVPQTNDVFFLSEASGWSQLYLNQSTRTAESTTKQLTDGEFEVGSPQVSSDGAAIYFTSSELHPGRTEVYRHDLSDGSQTQITDLGGQNNFRLSPDGKTLLITHSTTTRPPELYVQPVGSDGSADARRLTNTISDEFLAIDWVAPEIIDIPSSHQERPITSRLYLPQSEASQPAKRPAVVFVHGAGYLQNAHMGWSGYFREFMFHTLLTQRGYVVLDMDYRASKGYGSDWRTAIYRQMGWPEVEDLSDGVDYLVDRHNVDRERIGVYGGSYGGFLAFMALFNEPDLFAAGAALRPVTDWAHYNHGYTSNILNTPELDPEAYRKSSPIEFAEGLSKPLLIAVGVLDDNVFFQDSVRLVQRLIELEKTDWEIAIYPVEPHGFRDPSSWLDEYRRILELFEREVRGVTDNRP